jgi:hypothetical protein
MSGRVHGRVRSGGAVFGFVVGVLALVALFVPGAAAPAPSTKFYSATIDPTTVRAGSTTNLTITIRNCGTGSLAPCTASTVSTQSLGSANVTFPTGFIALSVVSQTPPSGKTWNAPSVAGSTVQLRNPGPSNTNALSPGQQLSVTIRTTVPSKTGKYCLTTQAKQSNDFSGTPGNDFLRVGAEEPCVTVSRPLDHFGFAVIGNQQAGEPFGATVTAYDDLNNVKTDYAGGASFSLSGLHTSPGGFAPVYGSISWSGGVGTVAGIKDFDAETTPLTATDSSCPPTQLGHCTGFSNPFAVAPGPLATLSFLTNPTDALPNTPLTPPVQVKAVDAFGNPRSSPVTLGLCTASTTPPCPNPAPLVYPTGSLSGNPTQTTDATTGITTWGGLSVNAVGPGYRLLATSGSVSAVGDPFNIVNEISLCTGSCTVHAQSANTDVTVTGTVSVSLSVTLSASPGNLCGMGTTSIGDLITINPVGGSGVFDVTGLFHSPGGNTGGVPHYTLCKDRGPDTTFHTIPLCKDTGNVPPCLLKLNGNGTGDLQFEALITATDPNMAGGH